MQIKAAMQVAPGSTVAVFGAGGVGLSVIQGARIADARQIIAVDLLDNKLEMARHFGATHTVNASSGDAVREIERLSEGGVDYSFEAIGNRQVAEQAFYCLATRAPPRWSEQFRPGRRSSSTPATSSSKREFRVATWAPIVSASTCPSISISIGKAASTSTTW
jgi:S-(hydroxymethyl)glutathione dehydrogenase/alcohol dehydrogenase